MTQHVRHLERCCGLLWQVNIFNCPDHGQDLYAEDHSRRQCIRFLGHEAPGSGYKRQQGYGRAAFHFLMAKCPGQTPDVTVQAFLPLA